MDRKQDCSTKYSLDKKLRGALTQSTIERCYICEKIHTVNSNIQDMKKDDLSQRRGRNSDIVEHTPVWIIDEEEFLLLVMKSHCHSKVLTHHPCLITLAEALGESDTSSTITTQLWKPCKSWWDAKSGKNPYLDCKNHRKRWR